MFVVGASGMAGCAGHVEDEPDDTTATTEPQTYQTDDVATLVESFVDPTRPTPATDFSPAADSRTIETTIVFPEPARDPLPLVVLAHGHASNPGRFSLLMAAWARAGYIVAAPRFPRATDDQPGGLQAAQFTDVLDQPADLSFVIDEVLRLNAAPEGRLKGRIDAAHVGVVGHSAGGVAAYALLYNTCCGDDRVDAGIMMAAPRDQIAHPEGTYEPRPIPALLIVADGDFVFEPSKAVYPELAPPKWLITLHGGDVARHWGPFEDVPDPADELVIEATVAYWDLELKGRSEAALTLARAAGPADGSATVDHQG